MENEKLISVIIPVYNVEKYLPRCLDSLLNQTYSCWEAILIDDGTPDKSGVICDEYANRDNRFVVIHKENGGVSSARNSGLDKASGEFVFFLDSDDYIEPECFETLIHIQNEQQADIVHCLSTLDKQSLYTNEIIEIDDTKLDSTFVLCMVWGNLYKSSLIKGTRFNTDIHYGEDTLFGTTAYINAKKVVEVRKSFYYYDRTTGGITTKPINSKQLTVLNTYHEIMKQCKDNAFLTEYFESWYLDQLLKLVLSVWRCRREGKKTNREDLFLVKEYKAHRKYVSYGTLRRLERLRMKVFLALGSKYYYVWNSKIVRYLEDKLSMHELS